MSIIKLRSRAEFLAEPIKAAVMSGKRIVTLRDGSLARIYSVEHIDMNEGRIIAGRTIPDPETLTDSFGRNLYWFSDGSYYANGEASPLDIVSASGFKTIIPMGRGA
jgi:hypothetical protein